MVPCEIDACNPSLLWIWLKFRSFSGSLSICVRLCWSLCLSLPAGLWRDLSCIFYTQKKVQLWTHIAWSKDHTYLQTLWTSCCSKITIFAPNLSNKSFFPGDFGIRNPCKITKNNSPEIVFRNALLSRGGQLSRKHPSLDATFSFRSKPSFRQGRNILSL